MLQQVIGDESVDAALAWYYEAAEAGRRPSHRELYERYPDLIAPLTTFFAAERWLVGLTGQCRSPPEDREA